MRNYIVFILLSAKTGKLTVSVIKNTKISLVVC